MARYRSDIPNGYGDLSQVGYWTPETPDFLEKREERRRAQRSASVSYTQAKANIRRISVESQAARNQRSRGEEGASIIDFERARSSAAARYREDPAIRSTRASRMAPAEPRRRNARARQMASARYDEVPYRERPAYGPAYDAAYDPAFEEDYAEAPDRSLRGRLGKLRHDLRSRKADRSYARRYGDAPAAGDEGPRAAVYRGQMGRQHQRAARMQETQSKGFALPAFLQGILEALSLDRLVLRPWFAYTAVAAVCMVLVVYTVYPAAQNYYLQSRANDQLAAEYEAVIERNAQLEEHLAALQTDEGMEELAHQSLGWVREDEHAVSVLAEGSTDLDSGASGDATAVVEGSVPAPETWYSPVLDKVFGYNG